MSNVTTTDGTSNYLKDWDAQMLFLEYGYRAIAHDRRGESARPAASGSGAIAFLMKPFSDLQLRGLHGCYASLTPREREVMALVAYGLTNREIAERLVVSPATAKTHVSRSMMKLHAHDRAQLVVLAYQTGLVTSGASAARAAVRI